MSVVLLVVAVMVHASQTKSISAKIDQGIKGRDARFDESDRQQKEILDALHQIQSSRFTNTDGENLWREVRQIEAATQQVQP